MSCSVSRKRVSTCPGHDIIIGIFVDGVHLFRAGQFVGAPIRLAAIYQYVLCFADNALGVVPGGIGPLPGHVGHKAALVKNTVAQQLQARLFPVVDGDEDCALSSSFAGSSRLLMKDGHLLWRKVSCASTKRTL
jgi:hypothetical protein